VPELAQILPASGEQLCRLPIARRLEGVKLVLRRVILPE
jgi:hypothetical protein